MNLILNIDTAVEGASICLSVEESIIASAINLQQKESAAWLHVAIQDLLKEQKLTPKNLSAIAISAGPGSYTGLRVGMSAAKGLCYALNIPLILINTLQMMAAAAKKKSSTLLCPMIDARRMEIFTAIYNKDLETVLDPQNMILSETSFEKFLINDQISFFGNGSLKFKNLIHSTNASFIDVSTTSEDMVAISAEKFNGKIFENIAYAEPFYGKEFYSPSVKTSI